MVNRGVWLWGAEVCLSWGNGWVYGMCCWCMVVRFWLVSEDESEVIDVEFAVEGDFFGIDDEEDGVGVSHSFEVVRVGDGEDVFFGIVPVGSELVDGYGGDVYPWQSFCLHDDLDGIVFVCVA